MMPRIKLGFVILQSCDSFCSAFDVVGNLVLDFYAQFYQILQTLQPAPTFPPNVDDLIGYYMLRDPLGVYLANITIKMSPVLNNPHSQLVIELNGALIGVLLWQGEDTVFFPISVGTGLSCDATEGGSYQYVYFDTTSQPITLSVPGVLPYAIAEKAN